MCLLSMALQEVPGHSGVRSWLAVGPRTLPKALEMKKVYSTQMEGQHDDVGDNFATSLHHIVLDAIRHQDAAANGKTYVIRILSLMASRLLRT